MRKGVSIIFIIVLSFIIAFIIIWLKGYYILKNAPTHRDCQVNNSDIQTNGWKTFTNVTERFSVSYPSDWCLSNTIKGKFSVSNQNLGFSTKTVANPKGYILVDIFRANNLFKTEDEAKNWYDMFGTPLDQNSTDYDIKTLGDITFNGVPAKSIKSKSIWSTELIVQRHGKDIYWFNITPFGIKNDDEKVKQILESFKYLD